MKVIECLFGDVTHQLFCSYFLHKNLYITTMGFFLKATEFLHCGENIEIQLNGNVLPVHFNIIINYMYSLIFHTLHVKLLL